MLRKELKRKARNSFNRNMRNSIIVCLIFTILVGGTLIYSYKNVSLKGALNISDFNNINIIIDFLKGINDKIDIVIINSTKGIIGPLVNSISSSGSFLFGIINALNNLLFKGKIGASIIIIIGAFLSLLYWIFISKVLEVGLARYFLENKKYTKTKIKRIITPYKDRRFINISLVMFLKNLYVLLWSFTIVGFFVKYYAYLLVPYILAENPNLNAKDALELSSNMMMGHKWEAFKLNISFFGYYILGFITFNMSNLVFATPYIHATNAEYYMYLRQLAKNKKIKNIDLLNDCYLEGNIVLDEYPYYEHKKIKYNININYLKDYKLLDLILIFFVISCGGWIWEVILHLFQTGEFVNRGTLHGPWLPIYGGGSIAVLILLKEYRKKPLTYFFFTMIVCGIIEYLTGVYLEEVHAIKWWSYEGYFLNLNGKICLEGLLIFGIGGMAVTYFIAPFIADYLDKINKYFKTLLAILLVLLISFDFSYSGKRPNTGKGISKPMKVLIDKV